MNEEYLYYLEAQLRDAQQLKKQCPNDSDLSAKIKWLCEQIYDLEMKMRWGR